MFYASFSRRAKWPKRPAQRQEGSHRVLDIPSCVEQADKRVPSHLFSEEENSDAASLSHRVRECQHAGQRAEVMW